MTDYVYASMGGPFLHDHTLVHKVLGVRHLLSIERDCWTVKRQEFNRPVRCIDCEHLKASEFVERFDEVMQRYGPDKRYIIWLDYMAPGDRGVQLREVRMLAPRLGHGDVLKVTLNANAESLDGSSTPSTPEERAAARYRALVTQLNDYFPGGYDVEDASTRVQCMLGDAVKLACTEGLSRRLTFVPLAAYYYSDGQPMATYAGIVLSPSDEARFRSLSGIDAWPFYTPSLALPRHIGVPQLSVRERTEIDRLIGAKDGVEIQSELDLALAADAAETARLIDGYSEYYRFYPQYVQTLL